MEPIIIMERQTGSLEPSALLTSFPRYHYNLLSTWQSI